MFCHAVSGTGIEIERLGKGEAVPSRAFRKSLYECPHTVYVFMYEYVNLPQEIQCALRSSKAVGL